MNTPGIVVWPRVALLLVLVGLAHFNRISITVAGAESIIPRDGISATQMGWVYSAFLIVYTLTMSPGGFFIDRFGARLALLAVAGGAAVFMALTGLAGYLWSGGLLWMGLIVVRGLMGFTNAPVHPASARLVGSWIPPEQRNLVNGLVNFAALIGISLTYVCFGALMDLMGWANASLVMAAGTLLLALAWAVFVRDPSTQRPSAAAADDLTPVETTDATTAIAPLREPPRPERFAGELGKLGGPGDEPARIVFSWHDLFAHRGLLILTLSYASLGYFQYLFFYWAEYYFEHERELAKETSRLYSSLLTLAMGAGMVTGGWLSDWFRRHHAHPRAVAIVPVGGLLCAAVAVLPGMFSGTPEVTLMCFAIAMAAAGAGEGSFWTQAVAIGGSRGGLAAAILNTGGNAGGLVAPVLTPYLSAILGWRAGLGLASAACFVAALCWFWIDPADRLDSTRRASDQA